MTMQVQQTYTEIFQETGVYSPPSCYPGTLAITSESSSSGKTSESSWLKKLPGGHSSSSLGHSFLICGVRRE